MNKVHPYRVMEREYITSQISIRELCRRHNISAHGPVTVQAWKGKWQEKREAYQAKASDTFLERYAARQADREAEVRDKALDAIDEGIARFRSDLKATEKKLVDGEWLDVPIMRLTPRELAVLIDRLQVLFDRPSRISQDRDLSVGSQLPIGALNQLVELTRGRAALPASPLPKAPRRLDG
jgi:transposase-like protein